MHIQSAGKRKPHIHKYTFIGVTYTVYKLIKYWFSVCKPSVYERPVCVYVITAVISSNIHINWYRQYGVKYWKIKIQYYIHIHTGYVIITTIENIYSCFISHLNDINVPQKYNKKWTNRKLLPVQRCR